MVCYLIKMLNTHQLFPFIQVLEVISLVAAVQLACTPCMFLLHWLQFPFEILEDGIHLHLKSPRLFLVFSLHSETMFPSLTCF